MTVIVFYCSLSTILNVHCFNDHQEIQREGDEIQEKYIKIYNNTFKIYYRLKIINELLQTIVDCL